MDKSHRQIIRSARFGRTPDGELELCLRASEVCPIEIEEIGRSHKLIKKTFHTHFTLCPCLENGGAYCLKSWGNEYTGEGAVLPSPGPLLSPSQDF